MSSAPPAPVSSRATQSGKPLPAPPPVRRPDAATVQAVLGRDEALKQSDPVTITTAPPSAERRLTASTLELPVTPKDGRSLSPQRSASRTNVKRTEPIESLASCKEEKVKVQLKIEGEACVWELHGELTPETAQEIATMILNAQTAAQRPRALSMDGKKASTLRREKKEKDKRARDSTLRGTHSDSLGALPAVSAPLLAPPPAAADAQGVFGAPLDALLEAQRERYPQLRVPYWIAGAFEYILQRGLAAEGIFRISGSQSHVQELRDKLNRGEDVNWGQLSPDVNAVTGLVKLFLRELPEPLLHTKYYPHLMACMNIEVQEQQLEAVGEIVLSLPASHLNLLIELLSVCRIIAANSELNKMTIENLARLIGPNILRTKANVTDLTKLHMESESVNRIAYLLLDNFQRFFGDLSVKLYETDEQPTMRFHCRHWPPVSVAHHALGYVWIADATGVVRAHSSELFSVVHELMPAKGTVNAIAATEATRLWIATETMLLLYTLRPTGPPQVEREIALVCSALCVVEKTSLVWCATASGAVAFSFAGEQQQTLSAPAALPRYIAASPASLFLSAADTVLQFDLAAAAAAPAKPLACHAAPLRFVALTPDGDTLVTAAADGSVAFTNARTRRLEEASAPSTPILSAALHPDGGFVYAMTATGVRVWQVGEAQLVREVEAYLPAPPAAIAMFRRTTPGATALWLVHGPMILEWIVRSPTRRPTRYSRPRDLITPVAPMMLDQQHARLPAPTLLRHNSASRLRQQEISAGAGSSPSPPRSPDRASPGSVSAPQHVTLRRASSVGQRIGAGGTMRASEGSSPPAPSPLASASDEQRPAPLPNAGALVKRVALESKEALHVMACFYDQVVVGGAEGTLYIFDQSGAIRDTRTKAHQSAVTALICVGTQLWSGSDDGALHTWEMKERSLAERVGSRVNATTVVKKKEGPLLKVGKSSHQRWYVLRGEELLFYTNKNDKAPKGSIQLAGARCEKLEPRDNSKKKEFYFCIGTGVGKIVQLVANSDEERNAWVSAIDAALKICNDYVLAHVLAKRLRHGIRSMAAVAPNKVMITCADETHVTVFDPASMTRSDVAAPVLTDGAKSVVSRLVACKRQAWVVVGERCIWQAEPPATMALKTDHTHPISSLAITHQEQLVSISRDRMCLWDKQNASLLRSVDLRLPLVYHALSVGTSLWVCGFTTQPQEVINVWDETEWSFQKEIDQSVHGCNGAITYLVCLPDGAVWSCSKDGSVALWR